MKKVSKAVFFYAALLLFSVAIQSCCTQNYKIIGNGDFTARTLDYAIIDTITSEFMLSAIFESEDIGMLDDFSIIQTSFATSCEYSYANFIDLSTLEISCNKDFVIDGVTIISGTNFIVDEDLGVTYSEYSGTELDIIFTQAFLDRVVFEKENYTFKINTSTDDGLEIENEVSLEMNL